MSLNDLRIVYMGTPEFAVAPLETLLKAGCSIVAVITAPDRPSGRGKKLTQSAVKKFALKRGLPVLQPGNLKDPDFISALQDLTPDVQVVVAFRMLPDAVWQIPPLGTINLHASLLPHYRGAAPINHAIINGETRTGVSTFLIDREIDTGKILLQEETEIGMEETAGQLHDRLMNMGAGLVLETVRRIHAGDVKPRPQEDLLTRDSTLKNAPKIHREDCRINWERSGQEIVNLIRGLSPNPGAFTLLKKEDGKEVLFKIYLAGFQPGTQGYPPGTIITPGRNELHVAVTDGTIHIKSLQQEGKKKMDAGEFLPGFKLPSSRSRFS
jgi:methionyl-tRNA formyltransferase